MSLLLLLVPERFGDGDHHHPQQEQEARQDDGFVPQAGGAVGVARVAERPKKRARLPHI